MFNPEALQEMHDLLFGDLLVDDELEDLFLEDEE
jgi:hypothetical protein